MRIAVVVDPRAVRRWQGLIRDRLAPAAEVRFRAAGPASVQPALPGGVAALLALEKLVSWRGRDALFDPLEAPGPWWSAADPVDLVIDLAGSSDAPSDGTAGGSARGSARGTPSAIVGGPPVLRPAFDGLGSELALVSTLLGGRMPTVAVVDARDGSALASGRPSAEAGGGLTGALDAALSRAAVLLEGVVSAPRRPPAGPAPVRLDPAPPRPAAVLLRSVARSAAYAAYKLCMFTPHWRVGWRRHGGPGVVERLDLDGPAWTALPDPGHRFFADPFPVSWNGREAIFFEDFDHRTGKGTISAVEMVDGRPGAPVPALEEPWHLSYPFLVAEAGQLYMLPEASLSGEVALYRCTAFPGGWERCATLLAGVEAADATLLRHGGRHWLFAVTRDGRGGYSDTLRIWHAPGLFGPYEEHGLRPVAVDVASARPAGNIVAGGGALWRPFQDCADGYGRALGLARIDRLDPDRFDETVVARLRPGPSWPGRRIHTVNRWGTLECIDGSASVPRLPALRPLAASLHVGAGRETRERAQPPA